MKISGILSLLWLVLWVLMVSDYPGSHKTMTEGEKSFILKSLSHQVSDNTKSRHQKPPWKKIFTSMPVWAIIVGHWAGDWGAYIMFTCLPSFMSEVLGFDIATVNFQNFIQNL